MKPVELMRWLVKLVCPPDGTVLDPFLGSGTTAMACELDGYNWVGIEKTDEYLPIAEARIAWARANRGRVNVKVAKPRKPPEGQTTLFG